MPDIQAFRGIRYDLGHVGALSDVIAPPYDVIDDALRDELYAKHPANVVRLILNREEPGDAGEERYGRAARFWQQWQSEGILFTESDPAIYVYHQEYEHEGARHTRRGYIARLRLSPFGEGQVFPHEETMPGPKKDRLALMHACRANLSAIFGLYPDPEATAQNLLEAAIAGQTPIEAADHLGVIHRVWPVTDVRLIAQLSGAMGSRPVFIADGHHRYETACNYRDELAAGGTLDSEHPANFVQMMCVGMSDPGMVVLPTHRVFPGRRALSSEQLVAALGEMFTARLVGEGTDLGESVWEQIETADEQHTLGLFAPADERWLLATLTDAGRQKMAEVAADHSDEWRMLGVSILHRLVADTLLADEQLGRATFVHRVDEVVDALEKDAGDSARYAFAALVMPATLEHIERISQLRERMPPKSTYFYPKLASGLVFNPLE